MYSLYSCSSLLCEVINGYMSMTLIQLKEFYFPSYSTSIIHDSQLPSYNKVSSIKRQRIVRYRIYLRGFHSLTILQPFFSFNCLELVVSCLLLSFRTPDASLPYYRSYVALSISLNNFFKVPPSSAVPIEHVPQHDGISRQTHSSIPAGPCNRG